MIQYIYVLKCPNCEDEYFDLFDEAKQYALERISKQPIITQTEVNRNDFGECTDHCDLGTVWSWEDMMSEPEGGYTDAEPTKSIFTKDDLKPWIEDEDPEFDDDFYFDTGLVEAVAPTKISFKTKEAYEEFIKLCSEIGIVTGSDLKRFMADNNANDGNLLDKLREYRAELGDNFKFKEYTRKPIPEGMTIEQLVEEMEENEDTVECTKCGGLFEKATCRHNTEGFGWCCTSCEPADTLTEDTQEEYDLATLVKDSINHLTNDLGKDPWEDGFADDVISDLENNYDIAAPEDPIKYRDWCSAVACEVSRQVNNQLNEDTEHEELHDLSNTYDGGYPEIRTWECYLNGDDLGTVEAATEEEAYLKMEKTWPEYNYNNEDVQVIPVDESEEPTSKIEELEEAADYRKHLSLCPECGANESFDHETGFCLKCGFNI